MISYEPLWETMKDKGVSTYKLINEYGINLNTITCLKHGRHISTFTPEKLCIILDCSPNDIIKITKEEASRARLWTFFVLLYNLYK